MKTLSAIIELDIRNLFKSHMSSDEDPQFKGLLDVYHYAMFPAGKLIRSKLIWSTLCDLNQSDLVNLHTANFPNHQLFSAAIEAHHSYTLVHDDMPCMDNDDYRRGKLSCHKNFGEWKALLSGDGLLNLSYEFLSRIKHQNLSKLLSLFSKNLGSKGLIYGQYLDLNTSSSKLDFNTIKKIHYLKTGLLFSTAMNGSALLSSDNTSDNLIKNIESSVESIGPLFQFLDDLTELSSIKDNSHELEINPWINFKKDTLECTQLFLEKTNKSLEELPNTNLVIRELFQKIKLFLIANKKEISPFFNQGELDPMISLLDQS